jgi:DNA-binding MarR family transcriptional regulator
MDFDKHTELQLLEALEQEPETSQADLAARAGVAVGTVNWYMKRWSAKGFIVVKRIGRWRWRYLLTPQGMAEKSLLAKKYIEASMRIYRATRIEAKVLLLQVRDAGYESVFIDGEGDIADICQLTSLELGLTAAPDLVGNLPVLRVLGMSMTLIWPDVKSDHTHNSNVTHPELTASKTEIIGDDR